MLAMPTFLLDVTAYLLLKSGKNSSISFFLAKIGDNVRFCCHFGYGESTTFIHKSIFLHYQKRLNPHRWTFTAINPRYVQPGVRADNW